MDRPTALSTPLLANLSGYIAGRFVAGEGAAVTVRNPATGAVIVRLPGYAASETLRAVEAAEKALRMPAPVPERRRWLEAIAAAQLRHREALAAIITEENGKPLAEARAEVDYAAGFYSEAARRITELEPRRLPAEPRQHQWTVFCRPAGVAALITPWNFPLAMLAKKASAALAAGAPIVVKPAEKTPLSVIALFHLLHEIGLPQGIANLVFGDAPAIGRVLCEHPAVRVVSFTGSTAVGKLLSAQAAPHIKRMALELGGNAPFIVFDDADLDSAVRHLIANKFRCSGQTCVCSNRVYVQVRAKHAFLERAARQMAALKVGPGAEAGSQVGPLIDRAGFAKVAELVKDALDAGARAVLGGVEPTPPEDAPMFYRPTLLDGVTGAMRCTREEVFGPVVPVVTFDTEDEAVRAANATEYGLAAYVFSADAVRAQRVAALLRFGHVGVNSGTGPTPEAPFGGMKQSGLGREGGVEGLLEYVELQVTASPVAG